MSTHPQWQSLHASNQISRTSQQTLRSTAQTKVPKQVPKKHSTKAEQLNQDQTSTTHLNQRLQRKAFTENNRSPDDAKSNDPRQNDACVSSLHPPGATEPLSKDPSANVSQSSRMGNSHLQKRKEQPKLRNICPQLKADSSVTSPYRTVSQEEPNRSSIEETHPNQPISDKKSTNSQPKRRSKTESSKTIIKSKVHSLSVKSRNRPKEKKIGRCKNSSPTEASDSLDENAGNVFRVTAAGQHGCIKNAGTGSDSHESSFTVVNIDQADIIKDQVKTTRCVGTSIQGELLLQRGLLGSHRSVGIQADGSDHTPKDAKTLFQKLLPRISALSTKRKQASNDTSGQSSRSDFSNTRSYFGSQSMQSCPERGCSTVEVQYAVSGNVKAILRTPSLPSKYSSRCSAIWSGDRLTPIIQGVSLSPPRTPPTIQSPKTLKSAPSRPGPSRARL